MGKIVAINPSGREVQIDEDALPYLQRANPKWREKSTEEKMVQEGESFKNDYYSGAGQTAQAFGEGVIGGLTLGVVQPDDEEAQQRAERHGVANTLGNITGMILPAVVSGGATLPESGAEIGIETGAKSVAGDLLANTPAGLLQRGASAAAGKIATTRAGQMAAQGAIEGFGAAAGQNIGAALRDDPVTQESVVTSLGLGTILGYGMGAIGGKALDKLEGKAAKTLASKLNVEIPGLEGEASPAFKSVLEGPEAEAYNARISAAMQDAQDHLDSRLAKGNWFVDEMEQRGNQHALDFETEFNGKNSYPELDPEGVTKPTSGEKTGAYAKPRTPPAGAHGPEYPEYSNNMYEDVVGPQEQMPRIRPGVEKSDSVLIQGINTEPGEVVDPSMSKFTRDNMFVGGNTQVSPPPEVNVGESQVVGSQGDTMAEGMPSSLHDQENVLHREYWTPEHEAAGAAMKKMTGYQYAKKMLTGTSDFGKVPDFTIAGLRKMTPEQAAHATAWMEQLDKMSPEAAKFLDDAMAGAFNTTPLAHPAELIDVLDMQGRSIGKMSGGVTEAEHPGMAAIKSFKLSQEAMDLLGNSGKAKNLAALWSTVKGIDEHAANAVSEEAIHGVISGHIKAATGDMGEAISKANKDSEGFLEHGVTNGKGHGSGIMQRAVKRSVGRSAAHLAAKVGLGAGIGGAAGYALGWGVADSLLFGGMVGGVGNRIARLASAARRRALISVAKALAGQGGSARGAMAGFVSARDALATPAGVGEESHKSKDLRTLYNMRREQALKYNGQHALEAATQTMSPVAQVSPELAKSFVQDAVRRANYLANAAPKDPPWARFDKDYQPSREEMRRYAEVHRAVMNPHSVLEDFEAGYVSPDAAKAFRETSPGLYATVVQYTMENVDFRTLSSDKALNLSILLGYPVSANLQVINEYMKTFMDAAETGEAPGQTNAMAASVVKKGMQSDEKPTSAQTSTER